MARTKPSAAELALVAEVEKHGHAVTATQLERWRRQAWLPSTPDWFDAGSCTIRPEIVQRAVHLAALTWPGRSTGWLGWVFWAIDDTPATAKRLRAALLRALERPFARAGVVQVPAGDSDEAFQAREEAAPRLLHNRRSHRRDFDGILRSHASAAGVELPRSPAHSVPNMFHRAVLESGARMVVGGGADVGLEGMLEVLEHAWPDQEPTIERIRTAHRQAALAGVDLMLQAPLAYGLPGMLRTVEAADDRLLCAAVRTCTKASGALAVLLQHAVYAQEILPSLMGDAMWDQWVRVGGFAPYGVVGEVAIAMSAIQYLTGGRGAGGDGR
ncbi:hypothetical protein V7793_08245 [Streptomyces sp. KLMMK]|uniref:hypothetical protein n=1 Tax=Streptomyces sp. KLMMK TaxID=3109353 RepID=UPI0030080275